MNVRPIPGLAAAVVSMVREKGHLSGQDMENLARGLRIPTSRVYGFCSQFPEFIHPPERPLLCICSGPACAAVSLEKEAERWLGNLGTRAESSKVPGLPQPHRSPALAVCLAGEEERLIESLDMGILEELTKSLDRRDLSAYPLAEKRWSTGVAGISEGGASPWLDFLHGRGSLPPLDAGMLEVVSRDPAPILGFLEEECELPPLRVRAGPPDLLVCDTVGPSLEGSADLVVSRTCPQAVAAGAVVAAMAVGARKVVFYIPWRDEKLEESLRPAAEEAAFAAGLEWEVLPGPLYIPCSRDIGVASFLQGMMLWRAASICGRDGSLGLDPPILVCGAMALWKLPWILDDAGRGERWRERRTLVLACPDGTSRWVEPPITLSAHELAGLLEKAMGEREPKAFYLEGVLNRMYAAAAELVEIPPGTRRILVLEQPTCMAKWSRRMLEVASEDCCGGCTPGRTAPAAAGAILASMVEGGGGEEELRKTAGMLERAELLALCPQLRRTFPVVRACLDLFPEDFQSRSASGDGSEHMASGSGKARGMGGRR
ncbi:MAG: NADH-ubiquinone oxidoreductase-F iron-sulfur binding region domain-containing protein [Actinomycetota bacterium]